MTRKGWTFYTPYSSTSGSYASVAIVLTAIAIAVGIPLFSAWRFPWSIPIWIGLFLFLAGRRRNRGGGNRPPGSSGGAGRPVRPIVPNVLVGAGRNDLPRE